ncbi:hypothetical protein HG263_07520 [Pseudoalteromonas sp. JBTF-M23]|uniref:Solute-binding protein family 3/N-terminal domain-containing protein n=1 Tax=Pseudoalteromonas caenipelagi TaxID=2726988 RepID=A0A849V9V0_9GAMM|nr:transporter substrate-binding domain-containing protein [Pseudoalteromonas caenipelagi]NOU50389.1 hypothetical protein [Pseudoalteromonas caenipelagi]
MYVRLIKSAVFLPCFFSGFWAVAVQLYVDDEKDFIIYQGLNPTTNIANSTNTLILNALPQGKITFVPASYPRAIKAMRTSEHAVCAANKVKTKERLQEFLFSLPVSIYLSRRLYQHLSEPPLSDSVLTDNGEVKSLPALFKVYTQALIVFTPTMSYGPFFDKQFEQVKRENKVYRVGSNPYDDMYNLFKSKRADFLLGYPAEIYRHLQQEQADYRGYSVADAPRYIIGYWMCNNNQQSREFLALFNSLMTQLYAKQAFYDAHLRWLPESSQKLTRAYLDELIRLLKSNNE